MATAQDWSKAYSRQAEADFRTFNAIKGLGIAECHKMQFLQMACEKVVKAHLTAAGRDPALLQQSHAYVAGTLPIVLRQQAAFRNFTGTAAREMLKRAKHLAQEIEVLAPAVKRGGKRRDNCEYPWEDEGGTVRLPLEWSFYPAQLLLQRSGRTFLKLLHGAIQSFRQ